MQADGEDKIIIKDIQLHTRIGLSKEERSYPQRLLLSVELGLDLRRPAATGNLADTVCYATLKDEYEQLSCSKEWILVEELAETVCQSTLERYADVHTVKAQLKKFALPNTSWVGIEITRRRASSEQAAQA